MYFGSDIQNSPRKTGDKSQGGNMGLLVAGLAVVILVVLVAFAAGYVMVAREQMTIDERLHHVTQ
jgi:hypothetical protein